MNIKGTVLVIGLVSAVAFCPSLSATSTSVSCQLGSVSLSNASSCSLTGTGEGAVNASISEADFGPQGVSFLAGVQAQPFTFPGTQMVAGSAMASESGGLLLYTAGPVEQGQMIFHESLNFELPFDSPPQIYTFNLTVGSLNTSCGFAACIGNLGPSNGVTPTTQSVAFTLGQAFSFDANLLINAMEESTSSSDPEGGYAEGNISAQFYFTMVDANGVNVPVQVCSPGIAICNITPEPAPYALLFIGLAGIGAFRKWAGI